MKTFIYAFVVTILLSQPVWAQKPTRVMQEKKAYSLVQESEALFQQKNYEMSIEKREEALSLQRSSYGDDYIYCAESLEHLASCYWYLKRYEEAIEKGKQALLIRERLGRNEDYIKSCSNLAGYYFFLKNYTAAIPLLEKALAISRDNGYDYEGKLFDIHQLSSCYCALGDVNKAIQLENDNLSYLDECGCEDWEYVQTLSLLVFYYASYGSYSEALHIRNQIQNYLEENEIQLDDILADEDLAPADSYIILKNLSEGCRIIGLYQESIEYAQKALEIRETDDPNLLQALALAYLGKGDFEQAVSYAHAASEQINKSDDYRLAIQNARLQTILQLYQGDFKKASELGALVAEASKQYYGPTHSETATAYNLQALCLYALGDKTAAMLYSSAAVAIVENLPAYNHSDYIFMLQMYARCLYQTSLKEFADTAVTKASKKLLDEVISSFPFLTSSERGIFWRNLRYWFNRDLHDIAYQNQRDALISVALNGALLSKGLLLNSDIEFIKLILESGDSTAVRMYEDLKMTRQQIDRLLEKPVAERLSDVDSLRTVARQQEHALLQRSKVYGDFTHNLAIDWHQVQEKLGDRDLAVEFVSFPHTQDSTMYVAYTLRKGWKSPKMTVLFEENQLRALAADAATLYTTPAVAELVWKPLAEQLNGVEKVYFSPSGDLYNVAIESLPDWKGGSLLTDKRKYYRLSSTRELALIKDEYRWQTAAVYGGLKYDMTGQEIERDSKRNRSVSLPSSYSSYEISDLFSITRGGAVYLPGTKTETDEVVKSLVKAKVKTDLYQDTMGTESSFKSLSGKRTNVLHIATHGFCWNEREVLEADAKLGFLQFETSLGGAPCYVEDKALTRSGLLFSGANFVLSNGHLPQGVDDGILTAKELTALDLRGSDLVVLSACRSGLGEITGDGVFGLQRGFKKAGANSLVMSLWPVDDTATQMLMTRFYGNFAKGLSKYAALQDAQRYVREYTVKRERKADDGQNDGLGVNLVQYEVENEPSQGPAENVIIHPYENPKYWAAFILLDGVR